MMKFSSSIGLHFGRTKYSQVMIQLFGAGGLFCIISWVIGEPAKHWFEGIGTLGLIAGLVVFMSGTIDERKQSK